MGFAQGATWTVRVPEDAEDRDVLQLHAVGAAGFVYSITSGAGERPSEETTSACSSTSNDIGQNFFVVYTPPGSARFDASSCCFSLQTGDLFSP